MKCKETAVLLTCGIALAAVHPSRLKAGGSEDWMPDGLAFLEPWERIAYGTLRIGVGLVAFGSAYYHAHPDNWTLCRRRWLSCLRSRPQSANGSARLPAL